MDKHLTSVKQFVILTGFILISFKLKAEVNYCNNIYLNPKIIYRDYNQISQEILNDLYRMSNPVYLSSKKIHEQPSNVYETSRGAVEYILSFTGFDKNGLRFSFLDDLKKIDPQGTVIDFGSGESHFIEQFMQTSDQFYNSYLANYDNKSKTVMAKNRVLIDEYLKRNFNVNLNKLFSPDDPGYVFNGLSKSHDQEWVIYNFWNNFFIYLNKPTELRPSFLGITFEHHREFPQTLKSKILSGRFFEEIPSSELPMFDLGVMNMGVLSYTKYFSESLGRIGVKMKSHSKVYILGVYHHVRVSENNEGRVEETSKNGHTQKSISIVDWINTRTKGFRAVQLTKDVWVLERTPGEVLMPELRFFQKDPNFSTPPIYEFIETGLWIQPKLN